MNSGDTIKAGPYYQGKPIAESSQTSGQHRWFERRNSPSASRLPPRSWKPSQTGRRLSSVHASTPEFLIALDGRRPTPGDPGPQSQHPDPTNGWNAQSTSAPIATLTLSDSPYPSDMHIGRGR
ncbi:hypothetical protein CF319_g3783 [Tilletia indica]|nr:hypothetical protein CF319_g3783 [Tilletia indica]